MPRNGRKKENRGGLRGVVPATAAQGQQYGERSRQIAAQRLQPMAAAGAGSTAPTAPGPGAGLAMPAPGPGSPMPAMGGPTPGSLTPLDAPSNRPGEPVTAGVPIGPGVGMEALGLQSADAIDIEEIAKYLPTLELMASQPSATTATRNWVRRLRAMVPRTLSQDVADQVRL